MFPLCILLMGVLRVHSKVLTGFVPGYLLGQTLKRSTKKKRSSPTTMRTSPSPSQLPVGLSRHDLGPRVWWSFRCYVMLNLARSGCSVKLGHVTIYVSLCNSVLYGWCNCDTNSVMCSRRTDHGIVNRMHNGYSGQLVWGPHRVGIRAIMTVGNPS